MRRRGHSERPIVTHSGDSYLSSFPRNRRTPGAVQPALSRDLTARVISSSPPSGRGSRVSHAPQPTACPLGLAAGIQPLEKSGGAQECDLVFWTFSAARPNGHVGAFLEDHAGGPKVTHASTTRGVISEPLTASLRKNLTWSAGSLSAIKRWCVFYPAPSKRSHAGSPSLRATQSRRIFVQALPSKERCHFKYTEDISCRTQKTGGLQKQSGST